MVSVLAGVLPADAQPVTAPRTPWAVPALPPLAPIDAPEFAARRRVLMDELGDGVLLALGAPAPAADYLPFQQDSRFRWLTGVTEPSAALLSLRLGQTREEILFVRTRDPSRELWEGSRLGVDGAWQSTGMRAEPFDRLVPVLDSLLRSRRAPLFILTAAPDSIAPDQNLSFEAQFLARLLERHTSRT